MIVNENVCCSCGASIPEGFQVCKPCEELSGNAPDDMEECPLHYEKTDTPETKSPKER